MGALATAWSARLSTQQQANLTNPDNEGATTVNATLLAAAETDASNDFFFRTGVTFDSTNTEHLTCGVLGITYFLFTYRGLPKSAAAESARTEWEKVCDRFNRTRGSLKWQEPQTNSNLAPTQDNSGALPRFDSRIMSDLVPRPPIAGTNDYTTDFGRGAGS